MVSLVGFQNWGNKSPLMDRDIKFHILYMLGMYSSVIRQHIL